MTGRFEQRVFDGQGRLLQASRGDFAAAAPRRFRWRTEGPFPSLLVSDGSAVWLYDEDLRQVVVRDLDPRLGYTPMLLLSGDADRVGARYAVERLAPDTFELRPRDPDAPFQILRLEFAPEGDGARLTRLVITDALDQSTRIAFEALRLGVRFPDDAFEFAVPEGVELVDERGA